LEDRGEDTGRRRNFLRKYWNKYGALFILGVACVLMEAMMDLLQPRIMSQLVDEGVMQGSLPHIRQYGLRMLGVAGIGLCFSLSRNYIASKVSQAFAADLRRDLFVKIHSLSAYGIDSFEGGSLITRETNDVTLLQGFVNGLMRVVAKAPFICIGAIVMAATLDLRSMPVIIPIVGAVVIVVSICMKMAYPRFTKVQDSLDGLNTSVREYLIGIRLVKAFRRFKDEEKRFEKANDGLADATVSANKILVVLSPFTALFVNLGIAAFLWLGAGWVDFGDMQVGQVMAFVTYMTNIMHSLNIISMTMNMFVRVKTSHRRVQEVFDTERDGAGNFALRTPGTSETVDDMAHIALHNVSFAYRGSMGPPALSDISLSVEKGETLGIIGPTGSGKTTLAALLLKYYEPTEGEIKISGEPLSTLDQGKWRSRISIVPQSPTLFAGTIRDNILWGRANATDEEIRGAAEDAQALEFIESLPDRYERQIGQAGTGLSGGQRQRVSIARALVRGPELLVLDDCTSALDVVTESAVKIALAKHDMTTVLITQRVSAVRTCDKILVLNNGEMAGFGRHESLCESCDVYRDIIRSQIGDEGNG